MAWDFAAEIHALTGFDADDATTTAVSGEILDDHADRWLTDGAKEVISQLSASLKLKCATRSTLNASATTLDLDGKGAILHITRLSADSGGFEKACREIPGVSGDLTNDSTDLNYYATANDPVFFITNDSSGNPTLFVRPNPTNAQPSYVHHISYPTVTAVNGTSITNFPDEAEHLVVLYASAKALQYRMQIKASELPVLVIPVKPVVPTLSAQTVTISGTAPAFNKPAFAPDFAQVNTYIDTDEDVELASAKLQEIGAQLSEHGSNIQNEQAKFNKENTEYQAKLQKDITDTQLSDANEARKLQKYQAEISDYSAELNARVQEFTLNLQKHTTDYQWLVAQYGQIKVDYQAGLAALKDA